MIKSPMLPITIFIIVAAVLFSGQQVSAEQEGSAVVKVNGLNVREGPGLSHPVITVIHKNETYPITDEKNDWFQIKLKNGKNGWVAGWLITKTVSNQETQQTASSKVDGLRIRKGPGLNFQIIGHVYPSQSFRVLDKQEKWTKLDYSGTVGWAYSEYLSFSNQEVTRTESPQQLKEAIITANALNVRTGPGVQHDKIGLLTKGDHVTVVNIKNGWYEIRYEGKTAWIAGDYAKESTSSTPADEPKETTTETNTEATVTATILNVREGASTSHKIIGKLRNGEKVTILETDQKWNKVKMADGKNGWVAGWYLKQIESDQEESAVSNAPSVQIIYNGTNIRKGPSTNTEVVARANEGDQFPILSKEGDWYKLRLPDGTEAYVAGWIVTTTGQLPQVEREGLEQYFTNKTVVVDPGHGGRDSGTLGLKGTLEKKLTLRSARLLAEKLKAAGAQVVLTRNDDYYISLAYRVSVSHYYNADAFVSLHYDSSRYASANGTSSFYYTKSKDYPLASSIQSELIKTTGLRDRGKPFGNFQVLRSNRQPATLLELGFLSNPVEEATVHSENYQENATTAILYGLARYFEKN